MVAFTICSDFGAQKNQVWHCFHCFPIYFPWSNTFVYLSFKPISSTVFWVYSDNDIKKHHFFTKLQFDLRVTYKMFEIACHYFRLSTWCLKNQPASAGDLRNMGLIPESGRFLGGGHGYSLQYSCLENSMNRGAWWAKVHRITKSWTWLKQFSMYTHHYFIKLKFLIN